MATDGAAGYGVDDAGRKTLARLRFLEQWLGPGRISHLRARGVGAGRRCLEVGAAAGSVARWLCGQVCPGGEVVAPDIDTRFLESRSEANLHVLRHDITADNLPPAAFDLVHCRLVLAYLPDRHAVLSKLAAALQPGGRAFNAAAVSSNDVLRARGFDPEYGRVLLAGLAAAGLADIGTEGHVRLWPGRSPGATARQPTVEPLRSDQAGPRLVRA